MGVTVVGDGEMSKPSYVSYVTGSVENFRLEILRFNTFLLFPCCLTSFVFRRLEGFGGSDRGPGVADLADYPGFAKQQVWNGPHYIFLPVPYCT